MFTMNKEWKANLSNGEEIRIKSFTNWKTTGELILIDDVIIHSRERSHFEDLFNALKNQFRFKLKERGYKNSFKYKDSFLNIEFGYHYGLLLRCNVIENSKYIIGSPENQIYFLTPLSSWFSSLTIAFTTVLFLVLLVFEYDFYFSKYLKVKKDSPTLWEREIELLYSTSFYKKRINEKLENWESLCHKERNHFCRLSGYVYAAKKDQKKKFELNSIACDNNNLRSCYVIFTHEEFYRNSNSYTKLSEKIYELCNAEKLEKHELEACSYYSERFLKDTGEKVKFKSLISKLCERKARYACEIKDKFFHSNN